jgi:hypothetical protein
MFIRTPERQNIEDKGVNGQNIENKRDGPEGVRPGPLLFSYLFEV